MPAEGPFFIGDTVNILMGVRRPGTRTPLSPSVVRLIALSHNDVNVDLPGTVDFTHDSEGQYSLAIASDDFAAGEYRITAKVSDGPTKTKIVQDKFVLLAPSP